jgi:hypothetical protein
MQALPNLLCPLCGGPNDCVPAACGRLDAACWCREATFSARLLERIPLPQRGRACVCAACARADAAVEPAPRAQGPGPS